MTELTGRNLGRYHILGQLGEGGMASVYEAMDTFLQRRVAVKVILPQLQFPEMFINRFKREARALAQLSHPNIVRILDYGEQDGLPYLVMDYIQGGTLKQKLLGAGRMPWREAVKLVLPITRALAYAHERQIVHRDVKPANILLGPAGEPLLSDFGIAKILETSDVTAATAMTATSGWLGTPDYMAPEQASDAVIDQRADIYSMGIMLYEMVTGRRPYQADTPMAVMYKKATEPLPRPRSFAPDLPASVETILFRCLQPKPQNRYPSAENLAVELENALREVPPKRKPFLLPVLLIGTASLLALTVMVVLLKFLIQQPGATPTALAVASTPEVAIAAPMVLPTVTDSPPTPASVTGAPSARISPRDGMEMLRIPAGEYIHGVSQQDIQTLLALCPSCQTDSLTDARPQTVIYLDEFWIDKTEVTNAQFGKFVAETGYLTSAEATDQYSYVQDTSIKKFVYDGGADWRHPRGISSSIKGKEQYPVTQISWQDASAYCQWAGRRLPTEAEWEKAARGTDGRLFPWGNEAPSQLDLNFNLNVVGPVAVGSFPKGASEYEALDMSGNLWEWVQDYHSEDYYAAIPTSNPLGPLTGKERVMRGGSWASEFDPWLEFVTAMYRLANQDFVSSDVLGIRCASSQ
jgi:eukaryotic-like serine/threonine-protein kinase